MKENLKKFWEKFKYIIISIGSGILFAIFALIGKERTSKKVSNQLKDNDENIDKQEEHIEKAKDTVSSIDDRIDKNEELIEKYKNN